MITKEWLVGFIEGEGNFNVSLSKSFYLRGKYSFEYYPILQFRIFLREDDLNTLQQIKEFTKIGSIYKKRYKYSRDKGVNSQDQANYVVSSVKELLILKELLLSTEFHTKKKQDMKNFFEILDLKKEKKHLTLEGYNKIIALANNMNSKNRVNYIVKPLTE